MVLEISSSKWFDNVECLVISNSIWLICSACFMYLEQPVEHKMGSRTSFRRTALWLVTGGSTVTNRKGVIFLNSCIPDTPEVQVQNLSAFWQNAPQISRLMKRMQFILMKLYRRKLEIRTNDWSSLIHAISNSFKEETNPRGSAGVHREYLRDSEIIEELFTEPRKHWKETMKP